MQIMLSKKLLIIQKRQYKNQHIKYSLEVDFEL